MGQQLHQRHRCGGPLQRPLQQQDIDEIREYMSDADEYEGDVPGYEPPQIDETWDCIIVVDNIPKVPKACLF